MDNSVDKYVDNFGSPHPTFEFLVKNNPHPIPYVNLIAPSPIAPPKKTLIKFTAEKNKKRKYFLDTPIWEEKNENSEWGEWDNFYKLRNILCH